MKRTWIAVIAVLAVVTASSSGVEGKPNAKARAAYEAAETHYAVGEFDKAADSYKQAYELSKAPALLFNIAQALRLKGDPDEALYFYETYLRLAKKPANRADVEQFIAECKSQIEQNAKRKEDERIKAEQERKAEEERRRLEAAAALELAEEKRVRAQADLARTRSPRRKPSTGLKIAGGITGGIGIGLIAAGIIYGRKAGRSYDSLNGADIWSKELDASLDKANRDKTLAITLSTAGATAVVAGGILYWLGHRGNVVEQVNVAPTGDGAIVSAGWNY